MNDEARGAEVGQNTSVELGSGGRAGSTKKTPFSLGPTRKTIGGTPSARTEDKTTEVTEEAVCVAGAAATPARRSGAVKIPTPSTGMPWPEGAPEPKEDPRPQTG